MYKKVRMLYSLTLVIMLTACNAKGNDSANDLYAAEIQTVESVEIPIQVQGIMINKMGHMRQI